jgi:protein involved in ribonucleotide reduction
MKLGSTYRRHSQLKYAQTLALTTSDVYDGRQNLIKTHLEHNDSNCWAVIARGHVKFGSEFM